MSTQTASPEKLLRDRIEPARSKDPALSEWIDRTFTPPVIADLVRHCDEKSASARKDGKERGSSKVLPPLFVQILVLPVPIEKARERFVKKGKYAALLDAAASTWLFKGSGAAALCHLILGGTAESPWLELAVIPLGKASKKVPFVLPAGFLTEDGEKRARKAALAIQKRSRALKLPPPLSWFRWKVVTVLAVLFGGLYLLGLNPLAKHQINSLGAGGEAGAHFSVAQVGLGLLEGRSSFDLFKLATPKASSAAEEKERVASADEIVCDLGMNDLLRKRFGMDEVSITKPILRLERRADGTINVGEIGSKEPQKPSGKPTDWVKSVEDWAKKIKEKIEERKKGEKKPEAAGEKGARADYSRKATYPFENVPGAVVRKVMARALEIQFDDKTGALNPPPLKNGTIEITNLSDRPEVMADPIKLSISGDVAGWELKDKDQRNIEITATLDFRKLTEGDVVTVKDLVQFNVTTKNLPLKQLVQALAGDSLNSSFEKGTLDLNAEFRLDHDALLVHAPVAGTPLFSLHGVEMKAKPGSTILGFPGDLFAQAVNEVGDVDITDLEIGGTLDKPEFRAGESLKELVKSGGKAFVKKQAQKGVDKLTEEGQKALDKQFKDQPELKKGIEDAKKNLGGALDGLGGGLFGKKKTEPPPPPPEKK